MYIISPWKSKGNPTKEFNIIFKASIIAWTLHKTKLAKLLKKEFGTGLIDGIECYNLIRLDNKYESKANNGRKILLLLGLGKEDAENAVMLKSTDNNIGTVYLDFNNDARLGEGISQDDVLDEMMPIYGKPIRVRQEQGGLREYKDVLNVDLVLTANEKSVYDFGIDDNLGINFIEVKTEVIGGFDVVVTYWEGNLDKALVKANAAGLTEIDTDTPTTCIEALGRVYENRINSMQGYSDAKIFYAKGDYRYLTVKGLRKAGMKEFVHEVGMYAQMKADAKKCKGFFKCLFEGIWKGITHLFHQVAKTIYEFPGLNQIWQQTVEWALRKWGGMSKEQAKATMVGLIESGLTLGLTVLSGGSTWELAAASLGQLYQTYTGIEERRRLEKAEDLQDKQRVENFLKEESTMVEAMKFNEREKDDDKLYNPFFYFEQNGRFGTWDT